MATPNICIFCPSPLDENTRPEHLIASAVGGRLMSRKIVCDTCNGEIGRQVDEPFADDTKQLRYFLRIRCGDRDPPPSIRVQSEHGPVILRPEGPAEPDGSNAAAVPTDEGFEISASGKEESLVVNRMAHKLRELGVKSVHDIEKRFSFPSYVDSHKPFKHVIMLKTSIGGDANFRAVAKAAFELLALRQRVATHAGGFDEVRTFVRHGTPSDCTMWDFKNHPPLPFDDAALGLAYHSVLVWAHPGQPAVGAVTLFGGLRFTTRLCEAWWGDSFAVAHAVNTTEGQSLQVVDVAPPPAVTVDALKGRAPDTEAARQAAVKWTLEGNERHRDAWRRRTIDEAMAPFKERIAAMGGVDWPTAMAIADRVAWAWVVRMQGKETLLDDQDFLRKVKTRFLELQVEDKKGKGRVQ